MVICRAGLLTCRGIRIEDLVAVTEDGCDILSAASKELRVIDV